MKKITFAVATIAAALSSYAAPALAEVQAPSSAQGHYEWHVAPSYGPRAPLHAPLRVWISDASQAASRDCGMMKMGIEARDSVKSMHGMVMPMSGTSAS